jgi:transposase
MAENRRPYVRRSPSSKNKLIGAIEALGSVTEAAKLHAFASSTANDIWRRYKKTHTVNDEPHSGRPRKLTKCGERSLVLTARKNCCLPFRELGNLIEPNISEHAVSSYLARHNYGRYVARKVPFLTLSHRRNRRKWARMFRRCGMGFWQRKIFSDECYIYLGDRRGRVYVTR